MDEGCKEEVAGGVVSTEPLGWDPSYEYGAIHESVGMVD
jgi:hypothetical protein